MPKITVKSLSEALADYSEKSKVNVLSLFDGMGSARIALDRAGIKVGKYYASEIDRYAIWITQKNYPDTIQVGDIRKLQWRTLDRIDLIIAGSPCQGFSKAGNRLNFNDPRSALFFEFIRLLFRCRFANPNLYFILENVKMSKQYRDAISEFLDYDPILINSNLVSAQNRPRYYWTNIPNVRQPADRRIFLKDILEDATDEKYLLSDKAMVRIQRRMTTGRFSKPRILPEKTGVSNTKNNALDTGATLVPVALTERQTEAAVIARRLYMQKYGKDYSPRSGKVLVPRTDGKSNCLTTKITKEHILMYQLPHGVNQGGVKAADGKTPCMTTSMWQHNNLLLSKGLWRRLAPVECERLQTVPDNFTKELATEEIFVYNREEPNSKGAIICKKQNVVSKPVTGKQEHISMENSVFYIIKDMLNTDRLNYRLKQNKQIRNVNIVVERLEKKAAGLGACAIDITKIGTDTMTHCIQTILDDNLVCGGIKNEFMVKMSTEKLWKITLVENSQEMKKCIVLILLKLITNSQIFSYVKHKANIHYYIDNLRLLPENLLRAELSDLRMVITTLNSDTQRYKMLGNGMTVDVIAHILKELPC